MEGSDGNGWVIGNVFGWEGGGFGRAWMLWDWRRDSRRMCASSVDRNDTERERGRERNGMEGEKEQREIGWERERRGLRSRKRESNLKAMPCKKGGSLNNAVFETCSIPALQLFDQLGWNGSYRGTGLMAGLSNSRFNRPPTPWIGHISVNYWSELK